MGRNETASSLGTVAPLPSPFPPHEEGMKCGVIGTLDRPETTVRPTVQ